MKAIVVLIFLFSCNSLWASELADYQKVKCVAHIHTNISSGTKSLESYVKEANEKGIGAMVVTDDDWRRWEFGIPLFRNWIKKVVSYKSVMTFGVEKYLSLIKELNERYKGVIVIDGVQTNPFYFWSGSLLQGSLALNNRNKDMLVIGLGSANNYRNMPLVVNHRSRFDAYHGEQFTKPYQDLINYVTEKGGLIYWSHPEYEENTLKDGIRLITVPYYGDLVGTYNYAGFGVFWEGYNKIGKPLGIWDRLLTEYCEGKIKSPIWAIGELEEEGLGNKDLDDIVNVVYVKNFTRQGILEALLKGRYYVIFKLFKRVPLVLEEFSVSDEKGGKTATMSEEVSLSGKPIIKFRILHDKPSDKNITVKLIRNNQIIKEFSNKSPIEIEYSDEALTLNQKYYYRLDAASDTQLISNPIFINIVSQEE